MQKLLVSANRMPDAQSLKQFTAQSKQVGRNTIACRRGLKKHIKDIQALQKAMFKVSETKIYLNYPTDPEPPKPDEAEMSTDKLWRSIDANFNQCVPFIEETIEKWNSRT